MPQATPIRMPAPRPAATPTKLSPLRGGAPITTAKSTAGAASFSIKDKGFAAGLFWQTTAYPDRILSEVKTTAANTGTRADLYCTRPGGKLTQWALGDNKAGHLPGHVAAAAVVASYARKVDAKSWAGAFQLHTGHFWFTSGTDGLIDPEGDVILPSFAALTNRVGDAVNVGKRDLLILPTGMAPPAGFAGKVTNLLFHRIPLPETLVKLVDIKLKSTLSVTRAQTVGGVLARYLPYSLHRLLAKLLG